MKAVKLLTPPHNYAVVQLPERKFPGVVFQGDSLHSLINLIEAIALRNDEQAALIDEALQVLRGARAGYEAVCGDRGITLPYVKS